MRWPCPVPALTQPPAPSSLQEAGENAGPVQGPDEGSPAWGQGWPQEPYEGPAFLRSLRCLACTSRRMDNTLWPLGTGERGLREWSWGGGSSAEGGLHLFKTPWDATLLYYGLLAQALPSCAWRRVLGCLVRGCVGVCV